MNRMFSKALASLVVAAIIGVGSFFLTLWGLTNFWDGAWDMDVLSLISFWSGGVFGICAGLLRWNVRS